MEYLIYASIGFIAGCINSLAGNGSALTLASMVFFGLDTQTANATNRIGILFQTGVGAGTLLKDQKDSENKIWWQIGVATLGGALGAILSLYVSSEGMLTILPYVFIFLMLWMIKDLIFHQKKASDIPYKAGIEIYIFCFFAGIYAGFIQVGIGLFIMALMHGILKRDLLETNTFKLVAVFFITVPALAIFMWKGWVRYDVGFALALGQAPGGWVGVKIMSWFPSSKIWVKYLVIVLLFFSSLKLLKILPL